MNVKMDKTMEEAVEILSDYMTTYDKQYGYKDYTPETYINDVLYGLGISMSDNYRNADGFRRFKQDLLKFINNSTS